MLLLFTVSIQSCSDFDEINKYPLAANEIQVQVEYFINNSIIGAQQNPHIAERVFVLYWKDAGRMDWIGTLSEGGANSGWTGDYYNYLSSWLTRINTAIKIAENEEATGNPRAHISNLKQVARIWRAYLMSEGVDNFGPFVIEGYQGTNPKFSSVEDVYDFMLEELKDAFNKLDTSMKLEESIKKLDPAYSYDFLKWKKYANSMRMRLAMRLSEVAPDKAKQHFEDAVKDNIYISELADNFQVQEMPGWNDLTGVMSREWNNQYISATINNLCIGLGGVNSEVSLAGASNFNELKSAIKDDNYFGVKYDKHFASKTNDPSAGFWFDGLHKTIDPRVYKAFAIPGDVTNPEFNFYPSWSKSQVTETKRALLEKNSKGGLDTLKIIDAKYTWNAYSLGNWGDKGSLNKLVGWPGTQPRLINRLRNSSSKRIFFASWETYFLIAEASVRGWTVPIDGKEAYEKGIKESFDYWKAPGYSTYILSEDYNRAGTSVSWNHTTEPSSKIVKYVDGYDGTTHSMPYKYPDNNLYKDGRVKNDLLTKIITQKFIAQTPWLPLETWNDHRRLGLPFFENPAVEKPIPNLPELTDGNYMESRIQFFPQRLKYPSNLQSNVREGYTQAVKLLGGADEIHTPLWWAQKDKK